MLGINIAGKRLYIREVSVWTCIDTIWMSEDLVERSRYTYLEQNNQCTHKGVSGVSSEKHIVSPTGQWDNIRI